MTSSEQGFTLVETLVGSAVLLIFFAAVAVILQLSLRSVGETRVRAVALTLAQQRLELSRNLPYESVGTIGGIPAGSLTPTETIPLNGQEFTITTSVVYIDDPYDDLAPTDLIPTDYKRVKVAVEWIGPFQPKEPLSLWTDVAPRGIETSEGTGTLSVLVFNAQGEPVPNAQVTIQADTISPAIDLETLSDETGRVLLPGAPICIACYHITATKSGFSSDRTYGSDEVTNPAKPHVSILEGDISQVSFAIDQTATLTLKAVRSAQFNYTPFQGVEMQVNGSKEIGRTADDEPVYKYQEAHTTGAGGLITIPNTEWDLYSISLPDSSSVDFHASTPLSPVAISPTSTTTFTMVVEAASDNTLHVAVKDNLEAPIASASVELKLDDDFIATKSTGISGKPDFSQAFFPNLDAGQYDVRVFAPEFQETALSVSIIGDKNEVIILNPVQP